MDTGTAVFQRLPTGLRPGTVCRVDTRCVDGRAWFSDRHLRRVAVQSLRGALLETNAMLLAWVLFGDRLRVLIQSGSRCGITEAIGRIKVDTAIAVNRAAAGRHGLVGPLWSGRDRLEICHHPRQARAMARQMDCLLRDGPGLVGDSLWSPR